MGLSDVQIALVAGWGVRGLLLCAVFLCLLVRGGAACSRPLVLSLFLLATSFVGSLAEYHDLGLPYARLAEVSVASVFVAGLYGALFKLDPPALFAGGLALAASNVLYTLGAYVDNGDMEAALFVIGGVAAVAALLQLSFSRSRALFVEWAIVVCGGLFYLAVLVQAVFGPWVLDDWNRLAWAIIWEVAITLFYGALVVGAWFFYTPGTPDGAYAADWFDMVAYVFKANQWSAPEPKLAD